jgi:hypothetical protein
VRFPQSFHPHRCDVLLKGLVGIRTVGHPVLWTDEIEVVEDRRRPAPATTEVCTLLSTIIRATGSCNGFYLTTTFPMSMWMIRLHPTWYYRKPLPAFLFPGQPLSSMFCLSG